MIKFRCKSCEKKIAVKDEYAGRKAKCPNCAEPMTIPTPPPSAADSAVALPPAADLSALSALDMPEGAGQLRTVEHDERAPAAAASTARRPAKPPAPGSSRATSGAASGADSGGASRATSRAPTEADIKTCPKCGAQANASAKICVNCGAGFGGLSAQNRSRMRFASLFAGRSGIALAGGLTTALCAGFIWAAVVRYTGFEIGWLAWGLGVGVGICVAQIARQQNHLVGIAAAFVALLGWFSGKVLILYWAMPIIVAAEFFDLADQIVDYNSPEAAHAIAVNKLHATGTLDDATYDGYVDDTLIEDEVARVEQQADDWIIANGAPDPQAFMVQGIRDGIMAQPFTEAITEVINWLDALWVLLMLSSAWKIGSGGGLGGDD